MAIKHLLYIVTLAFLIVFVSSKVSQLLMAVASEIGWTRITLEPLRRFLCHLFSLSEFLIYIMHSVFLYCTVSTNMKFCQWTDENNGMKSVDADSTVSVLQFADESVNDKALVWSRNSGEFSNSRLNSENWSVKQFEVTVIKWARWFMSKVKGRKMHS